MNYVNIGRERSVKPEKLSIKTISLQFYASIPAYVNIIHQFPYHIHLSTKSRQIP